MKNVISVQLLTISGRIVELNQILATANIFLSKSARCEESSCNCSNSFHSKAQLQFIIMKELLKDIHI